jgi:hypothetical protein
MDIDEPTENIRNLIP